jgi:hypothetical protein
MSNGRIWSEYQGAASSLKPETSESWTLVWSIVALTGMSVERTRELSKMAVWPMNSCCRVVEQEMA